MGTPCSIRQALADASASLPATVESPLLDCEVLLAHCLQQNRSYLHTWPERELAPDLLAQFLALVAQRQRGVPVAYLTGAREFWSLPFKVTRDTLIPRPETEGLIEIALQLLKARPAPQLIDVGTGAGPIACALAHELRNSNVFANDISNACVQVAAHNKQQLRLTNLNLFVGNLLDAVQADSMDLVVSNPPYIAQADPHLTQGDVRHEPQLALVAARQGLAVIEQLCHQARSILRPAGYLLVEHGFEQRDAVVKLFNEFEYSNIQTFDDLAGNPRIVAGRR